MSESAFLLYILIAVHVPGSLTSDSTVSTQSTEKQCDGYCFYALKPMLNHVAANQERWNACEAKKLDSTARLDRMESQLAAVQQKKVQRVKKMENFEQIGLRYFYIEQHRTVNWFSAMSICRQMGGYLATLRNEEELNAITKKLTEGHSYWLGISDLADKGSYLSQATGNSAPFLKWSKGEPNHARNNENCVELRSGHGNFNDRVCTETVHFICEAGDD